MNGARYLLCTMLALILPAQADDQTDITPGGLTQVGTGLDSADVISWRPLRRSDFRGERPPGAFGTGAVRPVAVSCAYVVASPQARIYPEPVGDPRPESRPESRLESRLESGAEAGYRARIEGLTFQALMSRSCSWWNPDNMVSPAYVLQHEQIHFDIFEVTARRLNHDLPGLLEVMDVRGPTVEAVVNGAQRYVQQALSRGLESAGALNQKFDMETSWGFEPQRQNSWRLRLDRDLKQLQHVSVSGPKPAQKAP